MLVAIDVGNTQTVIGLYGPGDGPAGSSSELLHHWRTATVASRTADEMALLIDQLFQLRGLDPAEAITGIAVASVVPRQRTALREMSDRWFKVETVIVEPGVRTGMPIHYDNPKEVGADRIADAVAAFERYGGPTIVVDFGTATTFEVVSAKGEYLGGIIVPGIEISLEALSARAALLPRVELVEPRSVLAKNTVESVQAGIDLRFRSPGGRPVPPVTRRDRPVQGGGDRRPGRPHRPVHLDDRAPRALVDPGRAAHHLRA